MFLHIVAEDKQYSVHADEKKPLSDAVDQAFKFHEKRRGAKHRARINSGKKPKMLALNKSPRANRLKEGDVIHVS